MDYFDRFEKDQSVLTVDLHRGGGCEYNPEKLKTEELKFKPFHFENIGKESGIFYKCWKEHIQKYRDYFPLELYLSIYNNEFPNIFAIEIPQIYRPASKRFLQTIKSRIKGGVNFNRNRNLEKILKAYFTEVCKRSETMEKYPAEIIAKTIANGIEEQILPKFNISNQG